MTKSRKYGKVDLDKTRQFNVRLPIELLDDLNFISQSLKINKSEWVKIKIAESIHDEKYKLLNEIKKLKRK
jgi:predicted DNA-binding protein